MIGQYATFNYGGFGIFGIMQKQSATPKNDKKKQKNITKHFQEHNHWDNRDYSKQFLQYSNAKNRPKRMPKNKIFLIMPEEQIDVEEQAIENTVFNKPNVVDELTIYELEKDKLQKNKKRNNIDKKLNTESYDMNVVN